jgi:hypothetical protein
MRGLALVVVLASRFANGNEVRIPLYFEPNLGQFPAEVRFMAQGPGGQIGIADGALILHSGARIWFARPAVLPRRMQALEKQAGTSSYFQSPDESKWIRNVPSFGRVRVEGIYPGVDVDFHSSPEGQLEYDLIVKAGADPGQIRIDFDPLLQPRQALDGSIVLKGLRHEIPLVHQEGKAVRYSARLRGNSLSFEFAGHDRTKTLVIDPVVIYSIGFSENVSSIAVDLEGALYVAGTSSRPGPGIPAINYYSYFVIKIRAQPERGVYSREYTVSLGEFRSSTTPGGPRIAADAAGGAYISGAWPEATLPVKNAFRPAFRNSSDSCIAKIGAKPGPNGYGFEYISYTGLPGFTLAVSASGAAFLGTVTTESNLPIVRPLRSSLAARADLFLMRINAAPSPVNGVYDLAFATYAGIANPGLLLGFSADAEGGLYFLSNSTAPFPSINAAPDPFTSTQLPRFVAKISANPGPSGNYEIAYAIPLGDSNSLDLAVDSGGGAVIVGTTSDRSFPAIRALTPDYPVTVPLTQAPPGAGFLLRIASKPDTSGKYPIVYSSYIDGAGSAYLGIPSSNRVGVDDMGGVWFSGVIYTGDLPVLDPLWTRASRLYLAKYFIPESGTPSRVFLTPFLATSSFPYALEIDVEPRSGGAYIFGRGSIDGYRGSVSPSPVFGFGQFAMKIDSSPATDGLVSVTIRSNQFGRSFATSGTGCEPGQYKTPAIVNWTRGANCGVTFTESEEETSVKVQHRFKSWEDGSAVAARTFAAPAAGSLHILVNHEDWVFAAVTVSEGQGSVFSPSNGMYVPTGTAVPIFATPAPGFVFDRWLLPFGGGRAGSAASTMLIGSYSYAASAIFVQALDRSWQPSQFVPVTPCRLLDTRITGGPTKGTREYSFAGVCDIPAQNATAYSINVTAIPKGSLGYLSLFPAGASTPPVVSTLNSPDGRIKANAAIVGAGTGGRIAAFSSDDTDLVIDIHGYFGPPSARSLAYYPVEPCRFYDSRTVQGSSALPARTTRTVRISPLCGIPETARAYVVNATVVPVAKLGYLRILPAGVSANTSTLNALAGTVTANTAIVSAGNLGAIDLFATDETHAVLDVSGYFAPAGQPGGLNYYPVPPCRMLDSRGPYPQYRFPFPRFGGQNVRPDPQLNCSPPPAARAWSLNATVLSAEPALGWFSLSPGDLWFRFESPFSTLNALDGAIASNAAIVESPGGSVSIFFTDAAFLILDWNGFFAQ